MLLIYLFYLILPIIHAAIDSARIKKNGGRAISHAIGNYFYIAVCGIAFFVIGDSEICPPLIFLVLLPLLNRAALFDPLLNLFLGKSFLYEGVPKKQNAKKSFIDEMEEWIGLPVWAYRVIYFLLFIINTYSYYVAVH